MDIRCKVKELEYDVNVFHLGYDDKHDNDLFAVWCKDQFIVFAVDKFGVPMSALGLWMVASDGERMYHKLIKQEMKEKCYDWLITNRNRIKSRHSADLNKRKNK